MRRALWLPGIADRDSYDEWSHKGQAGRVTVARKKVQEILASHEAPPLPAATREAMAEVVEAYSRA
jgi:trimethylamine:corrinoid methyltransferase-like protein